MLTPVNGDCIVPDVLAGKGKTNDVFQNQVIRPRINQREPTELEGKAKVIYTVEALPKSSTPLISKPGIGHDLEQNPTPSHSHNIFFQVGIEILIAVVKKSVIF
jgi:hypothetical protein